MKNSLVVGLLAAVLASSLLAAAPARGQVISTTVGIQPKCPYGLGACWPEAYDGLRMMEGVQSIDSRPSLETWTGTIRTKDGTLPDPKAWSRGFMPSSAAPSAFEAWRLPSRVTSSTTRDISPSSSPARGPCSDSSPWGRRSSGTRRRSVSRRRPTRSGPRFGGWRIAPRRRHPAGPPESGLSAPWRGLRQVGRRSCRSVTSPGTEPLPVRPRGAKPRPLGPRET